MKPWIIIMAIAVIVRVWLNHRARFPKANPNAQVLHQMEMYGADLTKPHDVEFFLYLPTEQAAQDAASQVEILGFETDVHPSPEEYSTWTCVATKALVPDLDSIEEISDNLSRIASRLGGEYDGWGTPINE